MTIQQDIFGYDYDDAVPAFGDSGVFWFHRPTERLLTKVSAAAYMAASGKTMGPKEAGPFSTAYLATHWGTGAATTTGGPPAPRATTGATAGTPGAFTGGTPASLTALQALGALGNTAAWTAGQYVALGDGSNAYWSGTAWVAGKVPAAPAAPTPGTASGWTGGGTAPGSMSPNQVGVWAEVTAKLDASQLPGTKFTNAAPITFTVTDQKGGTHTLTLPADTYDDLMSPSPPPGTADPMAWLTTNASGKYIIDTLLTVMPPNTFAGFWAAVRAGKTYLRVDGFPDHAHAVTEYTSAGGAAPPAALGTIYPVSIV